MMIIEPNFAYRERKGKVLLNSQYGPQALYESIFLLKQMIAPKCATVPATQEKLRSRKYQNPHLILTNKTPILV
jgi:hypothetical protein